MDTADTPAKPAPRPINLTELSLDPRGIGFVQDPYRAYETMHQMLPVFRWAEYGMICFARHAHVAALLRDKRFGRVPPAGLEAEKPAHLAPFDAVERHSLLELEPPDHTRLRGLVNREFVTARIEALRPAVEKLCEELIAAFPAEGPFDLLKAYATPIPVMIIADFIGVPREAAPMLLAWSHAMVAMYQAKRTRETETAAASAAAEFAACLRGVVARRRLAPRDDLLSRLIRHEGKSLNEDELVSTCILLLNAGHEATVHTIGNGVKAIIESGIDAAQAFAGKAAARKTGEEVLRFAPPLHMFTRYAQRDCEFKGLPFKQGQQAGLLLAAANRDPSVFESPDVFDPKRGKNPHVSFGAGIHFCLGAPLARLELEIALTALFKARPNLKISDPPYFGDTYHFHGLGALMVE